MPKSLNKNIRGASHPLCFGQEKDKYSYMNDNHSGEFLAAIQGGLLTILTKFDFGFFGHHLQHTISIIIQALIGVLTVKIYKLYFEQRTMDFIKKYMIKFFNIHPNEKENDKK